ncbi:MAG: DUF302 domain-containing protein [Gammaproteobacteria bacterium]|nr:DUF302 domain-containing protein [Gammaproteobacteria bacterium]
MKKLGLALILMVIGQSYADQPQSTQQGPMVIYQSEESFEDVIENIKMAIEERGMLVSGTLHVSDMLNRTGPDLGYSKVFEKAESVEFCSASISHQMTQVAAENMSVCPFTISVYVKSAEPDQLYVAYRRQQLAGEAAEVTQAIEEMLDGIVQDSIE